MTTEPLAVPLEPEVTDNHDVVVDEVQPHPVPEVTAMLFAPPAAVNEELVGEML